jgi:signal transduction histidine kinase
MTTVAPHLAEAIMRAGTQLTWTASAAVQRTPIHAASGLALVVLAAALLALAAIARVTRRLATLVSDLLQVTAAVASALFAIAILAGLVAVVILHG